MSFHFFLSLSKYKPSGNRHARTGYAGVALSALLVLLGATAITFFLESGHAATQEPSIKIGEKLTYAISFNNYDSAAYAEIQVVSKGKLAGQDAIELSGKLRSVDLLSAAFYAWDDARTTFISPGTGYPIYIKEIDNSGPLPRENVRDYLNSPSTGLDLLSLIYKVRSMGGSGSYNVTEEGKLYNFDFVVSGSDQVTTEAGSFDTQVSDVASAFLTDQGISKFRVHFSTDERSLPVLVTFETEKGEFSARLAGIQDLSRTPTPTATATPVPVVTTPTPTPTPQPYVDNRELSADLPFRLGERLEYAVSKAGAPVGTVVLKAAERKLFQGRDSLRLVAQFSGPGPANDIFGAADNAEAWVNPDTLVPYSSTMQFTGAFSGYSQQTVFDQTSGTATVQAGQPVQIPIGTHNVLSLAYAVRAFNLRPPIGTPNPSNDTRVALFAGSDSAILTLSPSKSEEIEFRGRKTRSDLINVRTGNSSIDQLRIRIWLTSDGRRLPLRLEAGAYRADLVRVTTDKAV
ncbi:MAG: DUF3108 domain-containing protein [Acidobacteria bacterium]|nr:MAG: DUF3108 domain-containing protein [Acidobacteriota bacterium]REK01711.1 MAG: DUF3108 domain-containing protein [Acidobacteriota bacterium]REK14667.1 MAG: DUF3108 domain-containing protein [Acidobacteriota bacterium]REK45382.1 MAG: DUF3108 domain-containing protein [Acidobacteriota bacterium]